MNRILIKGRLVRDPETRYTQTTNTLVASFSVAVNRRYAKEGEERQADFFNVTAWGKTGEFCSKYFKKGQEILIEGRLENRSWEDDQGQKHFATDIIAEQVEFCGSKKDNESNNNYSGITNNTPNEVNVNNTFIPSDDDLPF